uniref:UPAR/Ly6 domain-containing protein n=1 Tax=Meloidogyne incognita TaxID=6306 RepID=A0A914KHQ0_MELIC
MPLLLNKCCSIRLPLLFSGTQSFSLATIILVGILLAGQIGFSSALRCYQGTQGYQLAISGSPTDCGYTSFSCIKVVDYTQGTVTRSCQSVNCTIAGTMTMTPNSVCQNTSTYPVTQTFCCCYGDGCNSALGNRMKNSLGGVTMFILTMISLMFLGFGFSPILKY